MERLDLEHFKICLINNHSLQYKIDGLIQESFESYCHLKDIICNDKDLKWRISKRLINYPSTIFLKRFTSGRI